MQKVVAIRTQSAIINLTKENNHLKGKVNKMTNEIKRLENEIKELENEMMKDLEW